MNTDLVKLAERLEKMNTKPTRHDYDIGDWWNVADEAATALREAAQKIQSLRLIANVNGDWNIKYGDAVNRAEAAERDAAIHLTNWQFEKAQRESAESRLAAAEKDAQRYWTKKHIDCGKFMETKGYIACKDKDSLLIAWNASYDLAIDTSFGGEHGG